MFKENLIVPKSIYVCVYLKASIVVCIRQNIQFLNIVGLTHDIKPTNILFRDPVSTVQSEHMQAGQPLPESF